MKSVRSLFLIALAAAVLAADIFPAQAAPLAQITFYVQ